MGNDVDLAIRALYEACRAEGRAYSQLVEIERTPDGGWTRAATTGWRTIRIGPAHQVDVTRWEDAEPRYADGAPPPPAAAPWPNPSCPGERSGRRGT